MSHLATSNFDAIFEDADENLVKEVLQAFAEEDLAEQAKAGRLRQAAGQLNRGDNFFTAIGAPTVRMTLDDYWRQQVRHNAIKDPDLWKWFVRQPEGEYARVVAKSPKIQVGFTGNKRETIRFA